MRGLCVKIWIVSAPIASPRSSAGSSPPDELTWAPMSTPARYQPGGDGPTPAGRLRRSEPPGLRVAAARCRAAGPSARASAGPATWRHRLSFQGGGRAEIPRSHLRLPDERARLRADRGGRSAPSGMTSDRRPRAGRRRRPEHLLHPRERRQQALRHPRPPEVAPGAARPGCRSRSAAASHKRTGSGCSSGRRTSTSVFGTHNVGRVAALLDRGPGRGPVGPRDPRGAATTPRTRFADGDAGPPRPPLRRVGDHPGRLRQLLRVLHRPVGPRSRAEPALRGARRRGGGARRGRDVRGHPARPERQLLRPRPHDRVAVGDRPCRLARGPRSCTWPASGGWPTVPRGRGRSSPTCCAPSARSRGSAASASRARTRRTCGPRRSRRWPRPRRSASSSTSRSSRGATGCCAAMRRGYTAERYLDRLDAARAAIADLAVTTDIIVGFPGETERGLRATLEVVAEAELRQRLHLHLLPAARHAGRRRSIEDSCRRR